MIEERTTFLGDLIKIMRGTKEVERFIVRQEMIRHELKENVTKEEAEEISVKPELRLFTSVDGKKIQAALVDRDDEKKTFIKADFKFSTPNKMKS